jgi:hypothetical protein
VPRSTSILEPCHGFPSEWTYEYFSYSQNITKNYQNDTSKQFLGLTNVYFLTLNGYLTVFLILISDIMDTPTTGDSSYTTVEPVKYVLGNNFII